MSKTNVQVNQTSSAAGESTLVSLGRQMELAVINIKASRAVCEAKCKEADLARAELRKAEEECQLLKSKIDSVVGEMIRNGKVER